ncbi:CHRD domain-containing protein [Gemmatimonas sp.]
MRVLHAAATLALVAVATTSLLEAAPLPAARVRPVTAEHQHRAAAWSAKLVGRDGRKVSGTAVAQTSADGKGTDVSVTLEGDTPGATRPWHVHSGSCTQAGGVVGGARAYTAIAMDVQGNGRTKATIPTLLADTAHYYVNIHDATTAMGIIVACGELVRQ